jgi:hypothetical protein
MFYILILSCLILSCTSKKKERRIKVDEVVDYREVLFGVDDSLLFVEINFKYSAKSTADLIELKNKIKICGSDFFFKIKEFDSSYHSVCVHKICKVPYSTFCGIRPGFVLRINRKGQLLYEQEPTDSMLQLDSLVFYSFFNERYYELKDQFVIIDWINYGFEDSIPKSAFYDALSQIDNGYLLIYDSLSRKIFNNTLHNLKKSELDSLTKVLPYKVQIGRVASPLPPPPPPPESY